MPLRTVEVVNKAAVEQREQLCRFTENTYSAWNVQVRKRRMLILGGGRLAQELYRVVLSERPGLMEIVGILVEEIKRVEGTPHTWYSWHTRTVGTGSRGTKDKYHRGLF